MQTGDAASAPTEAHDSAAWIALPVVVSLAAYAVVVTGGFVWDDFFLIVNSPLVTGQASWLDHFTQPFSNNPLQEARSFYRPLITLSYWLDYRLWGGWPGGFHLTNLALHVVFVLLLFAMCRRAGAGRPVAAWLATLFAVSPRLSESVAWISGRTDIAAGIAVVGAMLVFRSGPGGAPRRLLSGFLLLLGLLSKEVALAAALALPLLAWQQAPRQRSVRRWLIDVLPVVSVVVFYAALRGVVMLRAVDEPPLLGRKWPTVVVLTFDALARYAWMVINPFQPRLQIGDSDRPSVGLAALGAALLFGAGLLLWKVRRRVAAHVWIAAVFGTTSLVLVLPAMPLDLNVIAADRFLYLPLAALVVAAVGPAERLWHRRRVVVSVGATVLLLGLAVTTSNRARRWASEVSLWREAVAQSSAEEPLPRVELSAALMRRGRYDEALRQLQDALRNPELVALSEKLTIAVNVGTCLDKLGHREAALRAVEPVVSADPRRVNARVILMLLQARAHRFDVASRTGQGLLSDFPYRGDLFSLVAKVERTMAEMRALPPREAEESAELKVRRAALYDDLGALPEAFSLWRDVALDSRADAGLRLRGASFVALFGYPSIARETLDRLAQEPFAAASMPALRAALELRLEDH